MQSVDISLLHWGSQTTLPVRVVAKSTNHDLLRDSSVVSAVVAIKKTALRAPDFTVSGNNGESRGEEVRRRVLRTHRGACEALPAALG